MTDKKTIREQMRTRRKAMTAAERSAKSEMISEYIINESHIKKADTVMCYMSAFGEPSTDKLIRCLSEMGKRIAVPVTDAESGTITPSYLCKAMRKGAFGISEPTEIYAADISDIDAVLVPGIAFGRHGERIGFGKGCYDRLLTDFSGIKIGVCYDFQFTDNIPSDKHDINMDIIITETGVYNDF